MYRGQIEPKKQSADFSRRDFLKASGVSLAAALITGCQSTPQMKEAPKSAAILIRNGRLIDGAGKSALQNAFILIEDGKFRDISTTAINAPAGSRIVEAAGKTVLPGLIDMHAHLLSGGFDTVSEKSMSYDPADQQRALKQMLYWGVTAVYDPVQPLDQGTRLRDQVAQGLFASPRLYISGPGFTASKGWAGSNDPNARFEPKNQSEVRQQLGKLADAGIKILKLFFDDMNDSFSQPLPKLERKLMEAIISEAHARNLKVMVHAYNTADQKAAIRAGADIMAHSAVTSPVDDEYIALAKKSKTLYLATLCVYHDVFDENAIRSYITQDFVKKSVPKKTLDTLISPEPLNSFEKSIKQANIKRLLPTIQSNLKKVAESGIPIGVGPDTGVPGAFPGLAVHREMELMVQAGVSPAAVLVAATRNAAEYLGEPSLGTIENGKTADVIIINGDPLQNIRNTSYVETVIKDGKVINREKLLAEIMGEAVAAK